WAARKSQRESAHIGQFAERILAGPLPWARMRQGYALLRLCDKHGEGHVEAVCQSALAFDVVDVVRIARMLKSATGPSSAKSCKASSFRSPARRALLAASSTSQRAPTRRVADENTERQSRARRCS